MTDFVYWPEAWPGHYNGKEQCTLSVGPCNCGDWHRPGEFVFQDGVLTRYGEPVVDGYNQYTSRRKCDFCGVMETEENNACPQHRMWQFEYELKRVKSTIREAHRLLGKVVPADQNDMIQWAVRSEDPVYTNAGAAFRVLGEVL